MAAVGGVVYEEIIDPRPKALRLAANLLAFSKILLVQRHSVINFNVLFLGHVHVLSSRSPSYGTSHIGRP